MVSARALGAVAAAAVAVALGGWYLGAHHDDATPPARVLDVLDGDTIVVALADGSTDTIRLLGVNTPKTR